MAKDKIKESRRQEAASLRMTLREQEVELVTQAPRAAEDRAKLTADFASSKKINAEIERLKIQLTHSRDVIAIEDLLVERERTIQELEFELHGLSGRTKDHSRSLNFLSKSIVMKKERQTEIKGTMREQKIDLKNQKEENDAMEKEINEGTKRLLNVTKKVRNGEAFIRMKQLEERQKR